jgi:hypothetical protein
MIKVGEWPCELIISLLNVLKCDFVDVDEAIFHDDDKPFELIFNNLGIH